MSASVRWDLALEVARWEFRRFAKPKQLLWSLIIALVSASVGFGVVRLLDNDDERVQLAVVGEPIAGVVGDTLGERFAIRHAASDELPVLREAVAGGDLDGLLMRADTGAVQLFLGGRAGWRSDLEAALGAARQQARLAESGIAPEQLAHVFEPVELDVVYHEDGSGPTRGGEVMLAIGVLVFAFIGLTTGLGYAFAGISGEKQQRITEQVVSAVPPQSWMDGKLLGLAAVSLVNALAMVTAFAAVLLVMRSFSGRLSEMDLAIGSPAVAVLVVLFPLLGFLLWFAFLCAISAVIDDPNSSTKGSLLMVPLLPLLIGGIVASNPDGAAQQFLGVFPLTSWVVLPMRLLRTELAWWEVPLALVLLLGTIWIFRRAAGKIFGVGMLMYGKEPTAAEMLRWAREP